MKLKPNYLKVLLRAFLVNFVVILFFGLSLFNEGRADGIDQRLVRIAVFGGLFISVAVCLMFTPALIEWDETGITIKALFRHPRTFTWDELEAYSSFGCGLTTFMIKFEGKQALQIVPIGFRAREWNQFQSMLQNRFPEQKAWIWLGSFPLRFRRVREWRVSVQDSRAEFSDFMCLSCGSPIPQESAKCVERGWTYQDNSNAAVQSASRLGIEVE